VLGEVVEGEGGAVFEEAEEGVEERHVHVDVFADVAVVAGGGRGTVDDVLNFVVLGKVKQCLYGLVVGQGIRTLNWSRLT
jgi:hypothetical protein